MCSNQCGTEGTVNIVERFVAKRSVLVTLDGDHTKWHVYSELQRYSGLVQLGGYLVVEDTILGSLTDDSPAHALQEWLPQNPAFAVDKNKERLGLSFAPGGWLKKQV